jgi:sulfonate transport system permease protein
MSQVDDRPVTRRSHFAGRDDTDEYAVLLPTRADTHPQAHERRRRIIDTLLALTAPVAFLGAWQLASTNGWADPRYFPPPTDVWREAIELVEAGELQHALWVSTQRALWGFALGVGSGLVFGFLLGLSRTARAALEPFLSACYTIPKLALLPLFLMIFGLGEAPKIMLIAVTVFFFMWIATMAAVMTIPATYHEAGRSLRATRAQTLRHIVVPAVLPQVFVAMRVSAGVSILVLVGAEFVQGNDGIGYLIWHSWSLFVARRMYVGIVAVALLGYLFGEVVKLVGRVLTPWAPPDSQKVIA